MAKIPQYRRADLASSLVQPVADQSADIMAQAMLQATTQSAGTAAQIGLRQEKLNNYAAANSFQQVGAEIAWQNSQVRQHEAAQKKLQDAAYADHAFNSMQREAVKYNGELKTSRGANPIGTADEYDDWYKQHVDDSMQKDPNLVDQKTGKFLRPDVMGLIKGKADDAQTDYYKSNSSWELSKDAENLVKITKVDAQNSADSFKSVLNPADFNINMALFKGANVLRDTTLGQGMNAEVTKIHDEDAVKNHIEALTRTKPDAAEAVINGNSEALGYSMDLQPYIKDKDALLANVRSARNKLKQTAEEQNVVQNIPTFFEITKLSNSVDREDPNGDSIALDNAKSGLDDIISNIEKLPQTEENLKLYNKAVNERQGLGEVVRRAKGDTEHDINLQRRTISDMEHAALKLEHAQLKQEQAVTKAETKAAKAQAILIGSPEGLAIRKEAERTFNIVANQTNKNGKTTKASWLEVQQASEALDKLERMLPKDDPKTDIAKKRAKLESASDLIVAKTQQRHSGIEIPFTVSAQDRYQDNFVEDAPKKVHDTLKFIDKDYDVQAANDNYRKILGSFEVQFLNSDKGRKYKKDPKSMPQDLINNLKNKAADAMTGVK